MADEIVLYTHPMSRGRIARWMLEEVGAPYRAEVVDYGPAMKAPGYRAINPMGKVPALVHGAAVVTECAAICAWLADAFPEAEMAPRPGDPARAAYLRWLFFGAGPLEAAFTNLRMGWEVPEDPMKRGMLGYGSLGDVLAALEGALRVSPYLAGRRMTAADVYVGAQLGFAMDLGGIGRRAVFEDYVGPLRTRPAAIRATAADDALMAAHPLPGAMPGV